MKKLVTKSIGVTLILLTLFYTFMGCNVLEDIFNESESILDKPLRGGFDFGDGGEVPACTAAYESDTRVFDIDDVTLTFYYGHSFGKTEEEVEHNRTHGNSYPEFSLYFQDENGTRYLIRHVDENFVSTKYSCTWIVDDDWYIIDIEYNYSETITIPRECFINEEGYFGFIILHEKNNSDNTQQGSFEERIASCNIYYRLENGKVIIYDNYRQWKGAEE